MIRYLFDTEGCMVPAASIQQHPMTYYGDMANICEVPGCERRVKGFSLCDSHLKKHRRGTLDITGLSLRARKLSSVVDIIEQRVVKHAGCWLWVGAKSGEGYGVIRWEGVAQPAHRWMYERLVGPIPDGLDLDHQCHNDDLSCSGGSTCPHRPCVNPAHLLPSTRAENLSRGNGSGGAKRKALA